MSNKIEKWEYRKLVLVSPIDEQSAEPDRSDIEEMNRLGAEGWELAAITPETSDRFMTAYFKRKLN